MQSVSITTKIVSSNLAHGEVHSIKHYVIQFVSDLGKVEGFLLVLLFLLPIKLTATIKLNVESGTWHHNSNPKWSTI